MNRFMLSKFFLSIMLALSSLFFVSSIVFAQGPPVNIGNPLTKKFTVTSQEVKNQDIPRFISGRLGDLVSTMFRILAIGSLIPVAIGGIQLIISQGGAFAEKGKKTLYWGVVGLVVSFMGILVFDFLLSVILPQPSSPTDFSDIDLGVGYQYETDDFSLKGDYDYTLEEGAGAGDGETFEDESFQPQIRLNPGF
jgi:hypothetical protein